MSELKRDIQELKRLQKNIRRAPMPFSRMMNLSRVYAGTIKGKLAVLKMMCFASHPENVYKELERRSEL